MSLGADDSAAPHRNLAVCRTLQPLLPPIEPLLAGSGRPFNVAETPISASRSGAAPATSAREAELAALSRHLFLIAEEEKADLARILHDTFGSNLTAINMDLNWIAKRLPDERPELQERLQRALQMLRDTVAYKQELIDRLRPSQLDTLGIAVALRSYCSEWSESRGIECDFAADDEIPRLSRDVSIALYRTLTDALALIANNPSCAAIRVVLRRQGALVRLQIQDQGSVLSRAFAEKPLCDELVRLRERVRAVGGTFALNIDDETRMAHPTVEVATEHSYA